jgi:hypothetical protein
LRRRRVHRGAATQQRQQQAKQNSSHIHRHGRIRSAG